MSHLRVLICRVEDEAQPEKMQELHRFDMHPVDPGSMKQETALDWMEGSTLKAGNLIMRRLLEYLWEEADELLVQKYQEDFPP